MYAVIRLQEHPDGPLRGLDEAGARVVVGEDLAVARALMRVAVGAVLAHSDAVTPAGATDHVADGGIGGRGHGEDRDDGCGEEDSAHWGCNPYIGGR